VTLQKSGYETIENITPWSNLVTYNRLCILNHLSFQKTYLFRYFLISSFLWSLVQFMLSSLMMLSILFPIACLPILFCAESNDLSFPDLLKLYILARISSESYWDPIIKTFDNDISHSVCLKLIWCCLSKGIQHAFWKNPEPVPDNKPQ